MTSRRDRGKTTLRQHPSAPLVTDQLGRLQLGERRPGPDYTAQ
jgi:hypothetical protein